MKKFIIVSLLFVSLLSAPVFVHAQTALTQEEMTQQLITLLTEMIAKLQQQIADILASNASLVTSLNAQTATIKSQGEALNKIAENTTPVVTTYVAETPAPLSVTCSGVVSSLTDPNFQITFTANPSNGDGNYGYYWLGNNATLIRPSYWKDNSINMNCGIRGKILDKNCSMPGEKTFTTSQKVLSRITGTPNADGTWTETEYIYPLKNFNDFVSSLTNYEGTNIDGERIDTQKDKINHAVMVWVKDGANNIAHAYCPITVK
jgi:type II secretory pathway pseudopilin PulG